MIKGKKSGLVTACLLAVFIMLTPAFDVKASGQEKTGEQETVTGTLQQTIKEAEIKERPDIASDTLASLEEGTAVIVYGKPQDSWSRIEYRGVEGYIESSALEQYQTEDIENLNQEFETVEENTLRTIDEYELHQKERRTSRIWGTVIAVLAAMIFLVGIISAWKQNKGEE